MTGKSRSGGTKSTAKKSASSSDAKAEDKAKAADAEQEQKSSDEQTASQKRDAEAKAQAEAEAKAAEQEKSAGDDKQTPSQEPDESAQDQAEAKADEQSDFEDHPQRTADPNPKTSEFNVDTSGNPEIAPIRDVTGGIEGATQSHEPKNAITEQVPAEAATPRLEAMDTFVPGSFEGAKKDTVPVPGGAELRDLSQGRNYPRSTPAGSVEDGTYAGAHLDASPVAEAEGPRAAQLTPPQGAKQGEAEALARAPIPAEAAATGLETRDSIIVLAGTANETPDADDLFRQESRNVYVSKHRLIEVTADTRYESGLRKLRCAQGRRVSKATADAITAKVKAQS